MTVHLQTNSWEQTFSPVDHVDPFEVDQRFAYLQAVQHQGYICQLGLILCQVVPQLWEAHFSQMAIYFFVRTLSISGVKLKRWIKKWRRKATITTNLSVRIKLHDDPHRILLYDPDQLDDVRMVESLHNY